MNWDRALELWRIAASISLPITVVLLILIDKQISARKDPSPWLKALAYVVASPILIPLVGAMFLLCVILLPISGSEWMLESRHRPIRALGKVVIAIYFLPVLAGIVLVIALIVLLLITFPYSLMN